MTSYEFAAYMGKYAMLERTVPHAGPRIKRPFVSSCARGMTRQANSGARVKGGGGGGSGG
jgi:hypothetical protein